jgi:hypothetical protein
MPLVRSSPGTTNKDQTLDFHPESSDLALKNTTQKINLRLLLQVTVKQHFQRL